MHTRTGIPRCPRKLAILLCTVCTVLGRRRLISKIFPPLKQRHPGVLLDCLHVPRSSNLPMPTELPPLVELHRRTRRKVLQTPIAPQTAVRGPVAAVQHRNLYFSKRAPLAGCFQPTGPPSGALLATTLGVLKKSRCPSLGDRSWESVVWCESPVGRVT